MLIVAAGHYEVSQCNLLTCRRMVKRLFVPLKRINQTWYLIRERTRSEDGKMGEVLYKSVFASQSNRKRLYGSAMQLRQCSKTTHLNKLNRVKSNITERGMTMSKIITTTRQFIVMSSHHLWIRFDLSRKRAVVRHPGPA